MAAPGGGEQVEFTVKPLEDLLLEGAERTITRVRADTPYSCLMLKNQRFSSLFRHYAKHHGLKKVGHQVQRLSVEPLTFSSAIRFPSPPCSQDDLSFFFTEELTNDGTPESVFLQKNDEIIVRKRRQPPPTVASTDPLYFKEMRCLLEDQDHKDVAFLVGPGRDTVVRAHKAVLVARCDYFKGLFREGTLRESASNEVAMERMAVPTLERMLEFIYTNRVETLDKGCSAHEVLDLLSAAEEYLLPDLKKLCEHAAIPLLSPEMVAKMLSAADRFDAPALRAACIAYILGPMKQVVLDHPTFKAELEAYPPMLFPIIHAAPPVDPRAAPPAKWPRVERERTVIP
jgi:hypothetical protein